jgi:hypothetical protein
MSDKYGKRTVCE